MKEDLIYTSLYMYALTEIYLCWEVITNISPREVRTVAFPLE